MSMRPFKELITFDEAKRVVSDAARPLVRTEMVGIGDCVGRVLASDIVAGAAVPGFQRGAMDGYAVIASDTFGASRTSGKVLRLTGKVFAGSMPECEVVNGGCMQIATGAPMPDGADAVVMVEETDVTGDEVTIYKPAYPGAHVSAADSDIPSGKTMVTAGTVLDPGNIGVMAALGHSEVEVYSRPRCVICPTGEEVVTPGVSLGPGKIFDINSYTLAALLRSTGAEVSILPIAGDDRESLETILSSQTHADVMVFSGGSSVGERDLLVDVIAGMGELLFHGIALKPGKPTICGRVGESLVFGMPGYPTSCLSNAYVLLEPAVRAMGHLPPAVRTGTATLTRRIVSTIGRHQIYMVSVTDGKATPVFKESGAITSMSLANGYIEIPANAEFLDVGTRVDVRFM